MDALTILDERRKKDYFRNCPLFIFENYAEYLKWIETNLICYIKESSLRLRYVEHT